MPNRLSFLYVKQFIEAEGYNLLDSIYINNSIVLHLLCSKLHKWGCSFGNFQQGVRCKFCYEENSRYCLDDARNLAISRKGLCLSDQYTNVYCDLEWNCEFGHKWFACFHNVKINGTWCPSCVYRTSFEEFCELVSLKEGKIFSKKEDYKMSSSVMYVSCKFGHRFKTTLNRVKHQNKWCDKCARNDKRFSLSVANKYAQFYGGKCLSELYVDAKSLLLWKCKDGHTWFARLDSIKNNDTWCPSCKCSGPQIKLYNFCKSLFGEKIFLCYRKFNWLKTSKTGSLELDIFIPEIKLAIEYDGVHHYKSIEHWGGIDVLEKQQYRDKLKNKLISEHPEDIKTFIRIPYWEPITEENVRRILKENGVSLCL